MSKQKVVYLAGAIHNDPNYQQKFARVAGQLKEQGYIVLNPAKLPEGMSQTQYMRICMAMLDSADCVLLLPDWGRSEGAQLEARYCGYVGKTAYLSVDALFKLEGVKT